tara:strand:- start:344 stop:502 length:159 start_codon:yes stop_codon:yes gene_type:complete
VANWQPAFSGKVANRGIQTPPGNYPIGSFQNKKEAEDEEITNWKSSLLSSID